jgi:small subunit ribosomal protein S20
MPYHASAKKRLRRDTKKRAANKAGISALRTVLKKIRTEASPSENHVQRAQRMIDAAATKGLIHKNAAARYVSGLMRRPAASVAPKA